MSLNGRNRIRLNIGSLDVLGYALGLSPEVIVAASQSTGHDYDPFLKVSEPAPFARNPIEFKQRKIDNPILITKEIQKRVNRRLLRPLTLPGHICGGVKGKSLLDNTVPHLKARVIVTLPAEARLWVDQVECPLPGAVRSFDTPDLSPQQNYAYTLRIAVQRNGQTVEESRRVALVPGERVEVDFTGVGALRTAQN